MTRRVPWQLIVAAALLALLATLGTLQYRWLGSVSEAERERMRAGLRTRLSDFAQEFDGELTRTYVAFHVDGDRLDAGAAAALAEAYARWQSTAHMVALVRGVYLVEGATFEAAKIRRFDSDRGTLEPDAWPPDLLASVTRLHEFIPQVAGVRPPFLLANAVDSRTPSLIIAVPNVKKIVTRDQVTIMADPASVGRVIIILLDAERLRHQLLEPLVAKYFGDPNTSDYLVTIARRDEPSAVVYQSTDATVDASNADIVGGLFDLRMDELDRLFGGPIVAGGRPRQMVDQRVAITIVRRTDGGEGKRVLMTGNDHGAWVVRVRHRQGSLDAIVAQSRRRNLAIGLGVLGLLAASVVLIIAAAQRQQRLARQQMEFVAAVSHELRTPLAVICSAGDNLADGVVSDASQVKRYGTLVRTEGRRLADMVERVMGFAGITSGQRMRMRPGVDVSRLLADAVTAVGVEARDRGIDVHLSVEGELPPMFADADALSAALQNVLGNAVKYSPGGTTVDIYAAAARDHRLVIRVVDGGIGIDADDIAEIFKPFFRGRRAIDMQIRGTGVGLSIVRHVVHAHHGHVRVDSEPGQGTTVTIALPIAVILEPGAEAPPAGAKRLVVRDKTSPSAFLLHRFGLLWPRQRRGPDASGKPS